jgi:hypothetical protein
MCPGERARVVEVLLLMASAELALKNTPPQEMSPLEARSPGGISAAPPDR